DRLGDFSADGFAARDRFNDESLARFEAFTENELFPAERIDRALIVADLRGERAVRTFARWRRQPTIYSDPIIRAAYYAFLRECARGIRALAREGALAEGARDVRDRTRRRRRVAETEGAARSRCGVASRVG